MIDNRTLLIGGLAAALIIGVVAVFLASGDPDGLESTALLAQGGKTLTGDTPPDAEIHEDTEGKFSYTPPMQDYTFGEKPGPLGGVIAIIAGTIVAFLIVLGLMYAVKAPSKASR